MVALLRNRDTMLGQIIDDALGIANREFLLDEILRFRL